MNRSKFSFRALQLDLARQPETVEFIKARIDFMNRFGYNRLFLYLEGRIRTKAFHSLPANLSYSEDEIKTIVEYAGSKGIETIPIVSLLGHAELFLTTPGNERYSELKQDEMGRFSRKKSMFCPSEPAALEFIGQYAAEVAALFPSEYFHAGLDESWNIGYCSKCRARLEKEGQAGIFATHINALHRIIAGKLGKKMMMWDDLFDIYPGALEATPRDVTLCAWHYEPLVEAPRGHCGGPRSDHFALYERLGFRYLFVPAGFSMRNITTFTQYAEKHHPAGALLTLWEASDATNEPMIAYAGMLWNPEFEGEATPEAALAATTPLRLSEEFAVARYFLNRRFLNLPENPLRYNLGELSEEEFSRSCVGLAALGMFSKYRNCGSDTMEEMLIFLEAESFFFELRRLIPQIYDIHQQVDLTKELAAVRERVEAINTRRKAIESRLRPDRMNRSRFYDQIVRMVASISETGPVLNAVLRARYPDSINNFSFFVRVKGMTEYIKIESCPAGVVNGEILAGYPFNLDHEPEFLRIESSGYVGYGLKYAKIETGDARYIPAGIAAINGRVAHPEALLQDGADAAFFGDGEQSARIKFNHPIYTEFVNSVTLTLKKE